jgi:hypothetical protein
MIRCPHGEGCTLEFGVQEKVAMSLRVFLTNSCRHLQDLLETSKLDLSGPCVESRVLTTAIFFVLPLGS